MMILFKKPYTKNTETIKHRNNQTQKQSNTEANKHRNKQTQKQTKVQKISREMEKKQNKQTSKQTTCHELKINLINTYFL
jgi:phosphoenolpyruvate synthase/pyruvate phosphate dikinase